MGRDLKPAPTPVGKAGRQAKSLQSIHIHSEFDRICCRFGAQVVETSLQT